MNQQCWLLIDKIKKIIYSINRVCLICHGRTTRKPPLCTLCIALLPLHINTCQRCGRSLTNKAHHFCGICLKKTPLFHHCLSLCAYEYPMNRIIHKIKYHNRLEFIAPLACLLLDILVSFYKKKPWPDIIIPVPLHPRKLAQRGFNQAQLLSTELARQLPSSVLTCVQRIRQTLPQHDLSVKARKRNVKGAFALDPTFKKKLPCHVAIVDDVVTTGATVNEMSYLLIQAGVKKVDVWALGRRS